MRGGVAVPDHPARTRLHIAFVIVNLGGGGAERITLQTADGLIKLGHRVDIVLLEPGIRYHQEIPAAARLVLSESAFDALKAEEESRTAPVCRWHPNGKIERVAFYEASRIRASAHPSADGTWKGPANHF